MSFDPKLQCLVLFGILSLSGVSFAQKMNAKEREQKSSVVNAVVMNAEAMVRGDLKMYENKFYDASFFKEVTDRETMEISAIHRFIFDHEQKKGLLLTRTTFDHLDLKKIGNGSDGRSIRSTVSGIWFDLEAKSYHQKFDGKIYRFSIKESQLDSLGFFDPRTIGLGASGFGSFESIKKLAAKLASGERLLEAQSEADYLELKFKEAHMPEHQLDVIRPIQFCNRTNMPLKWSRYTQFPAGTSEVDCTSVNWEEISNLYIPYLIKRSAVESFYDQQNRAVNGDMTSTTYLHWFSLNEPLPEGLLDFENLKDQQRFNELVDPVKNEADTILKALEKRNSKPSFVDPGDSKK
jgi:hypothetical protein